MSPFYKFQSYRSTYCTKLKCSPPPQTPNYPCDNKKWTQYATTLLHIIHISKTWHKNASEYIVVQGQLLQL